MWPGSHRKSVPEQRIERMDRQPGDLPLPAGGTWCCGAREGIRPPEHRWEKRMDLDSSGAAAGLQQGVQLRAQP